MALHSDIDALLRPSLEHMGFALVQVRMLDVAGQRTLQVMAEKADGGQINVDDCAEISHAVSALLDVEDPINGAYNLEVSSPGIDRPLVRLEDFTTYLGFEAKLETHIPVNGRKRYKGIIKDIVADNVIIEIDGALHEVPHRDIESAKLVLNDALLKAYQDKKINH